MSSTPTDFAARNHLLIAGTGRSGTSFLVRFLTGVGLDTHLSRRGEDAVWHDSANAGLEDFVIGDALEDLPYVVKSPHLYQFIEQVLSRDEIRIDAVVIPIRGLAEAAASRAVIELETVHRLAPWMASMDQTWEDWGYAPGGMLFSLNPLDQGRLLAVGLHKLLEHIVHADVPIVFLDFPRMVEDGAYLFEKLRAYLPEGTTEQQALEVHAVLADPQKVRVGRELRAATAEAAPEPSAPADGAVLKYPGLGQLDATAMRRIVQRLREDLATAGAELEASGAELERTRAELASASKTTASIEGLAGEVLRLKRAYDEAAAELTDFRAREVDALAAAISSAELARENERLRRELAHAALRAATAERLVEPLGLELDGQRATAARISSDLRREQTRADLLARELEAARAELDAGRDELVRTFRAFEQQARAELDAADAEVRAARAEATAIVTSRSWQMTLPLRRLGIAVRAKLSRA